MMKFAWSLLVLLTLSSNAAQAASCNGAQEGQVSPSVLERVKGLSQNVKPHAKYRSDSIGESLSDVGLSVTLQMIMMGATSAKFMHVHVTDARFAWHSDYAIRTRKDEMICMLRSGDQILLSAPRNDHAAMIWAVNHVQGTVALFEPVPYGSPLLDENSRGRYRGQITRDVRTGRILVEVPIEDIKVGLVAAALYIDKSSDWRRLLGDGLRSQDIEERKAILYANAALQCALACLDDSIGPSGAPYSVSPFLNAADIFGSTAYWLSRNIANDRKVGLPRIPDEVMRLWPENQAILLARLALRAEEPQTAEQVLRALAARKYLRNRPVVAMLLAYLETRLEAPDAASLSKLALQSAEEAVRGRCKKLLADLEIDKTGSVSLSSSVASDECWLSISVLRDARILNLIQVLQLPALRADAPGLDRIQGMITSATPPIIGLILAHANAGHFGKALSLFDAYNKTPTPLQDSKATILSLFTLVRMDSLIVHAKDSTGQQTLMAYLLDGSGFLFSRILWQCSGSDMDFIGWMVMDRWKDFSRAQCLERHPGS